MISLTFRHSAVIALISLGLVAGWGCSAPKRITYIPEGGSYTADTLKETLEAADNGSAVRIPAEEVSESRQEALSDLRTYGEGPSALADALTHQFPTDVNAIPFEVRAATYEEQPAWLVIESWGPTGAPLSSVRLWVFSADDLELITALSQQ